MVEIRHHHFRPRSRSPLSKPTISVSTILTGLSALFVVVTYCVISYRQYTHRVDRVLSEDVIHRDIANNLRKHAKDIRYICLGWHTTGGTLPFALPRIVRYLQHSILGAPGFSCTDLIPADETGYCAIHDTHAGKIVQALPQYYDPATFEVGRYRGPFIKCTVGAQVLNLQHRAHSYQPDPPLLAHNSNNDDAQSKRGIVMNLSFESLYNVYATIKLLRMDYNSDLPVELWINGGDDGIEESIQEHPVLKWILKNPLHKIKFHWNFHFTGQHTALYGAAYSDFDEVLVLDSYTHFLRDPVYLFDDPRYKESGALFWRSLWSNNKPTTWIAQQSRDLILGKDHQLPRQSLVHGGQMLLNRRKQTQAIQRLLYMLGNFPEDLAKLGAPHDVQDVVPLAWEMSQHMPVPFVDEMPGLMGMPRSHSASHLAGAYLTPMSYQSTQAMKKYRSCGMSLLQYDPQGEPLFVERSVAPLHAEENLSGKLWYRVDDFTGVYPNTQFETEYFHMEYNGDDDLETSNLGVDRERVLQCVFPNVEQREYFEERPLTNTDVSRLEHTLMRYGREAHEIYNAAMESRH